MGQSFELPVSESYPFATEANLHRPERWGCGGRSPMTLAREIIIMEFFIF